MSNPTHGERPQRVATPAYLQQRLHAFRVGRGDKQSYVLRDNIRGASYDLEPWQFFLLEVLPGCTDEEKLASVFEDRFGCPVAPRDRDLFFAWVGDAQLFNDAAETHPLIARFCKKIYDVEGSVARAKSHQVAVAGQFGEPAAAQHGTAAPGPVMPAAGTIMPGGTLVPGVVSNAPQAPHAPHAAHTPPPPSAAAAAVRPKPAKSKIPDEDETLPAGMQDATDFDPRASKWMLVLFNPTGLLKLQAPLLAPLRHVIFALPLLLVAAINLAARHAELMQQDLKVLLDGFTLVQHWLLSLVTVNLLVTWLTALIAFRYRATVTGFGVVLAMRFYPRFGLRMGHLEQLSRVERMWLHGAPLLLRLFLFCIGMYVWFTAQGTSEYIPKFALAITVTSAASLLLAANPLFKSNGYYLLAAFIDEPHLRGKAFKSLLHKFRGGSFKESNELLLATYAITMAAFMFVLVVGAAAFVGFALHQLYLGGSSIIVACIVGFILVRRVVNYFGKVEAAYERSLQFDRWRKRTLGEGEEKDPSTSSSSGFASYVWRAALLIIGVSLFLPYSYNAGGPFVVHPKLQQPITTDVDGRIEAVFYSGGETVSQGAVVARLASTEEQAQAKVLEMKMLEQRAWIDHLKSLPRPEEVKLARMQLEVEQTRVKFSRIQLDRIKKLTDQSFAPLEELDNARKQLDVDKRQLAERAAALDVAKLGSTEFEIAAAEAKWESLKAEREGFLDKVRRADLVMPFDGVLLTQYLNEKGNGFYKSGDVFADVESSGLMTAEIEVPESEAEYLELGSTVEFKAMSYSDEVFTGTVIHIDTDVTERTFGNVIKVIAHIEDESGRLKNGMTGYAKTDGPTLPVWEAFSRQVFRFVQVHVWSWIP